MYLLGTTDSKNENKPNTSDKSNDDLMLEYLIKEMQYKGDDELVEKDGKTESYFYAAQRLKLAKNLNSSDPCYILSAQLLDKLVVIAKYCPTVAFKANSVVRAEIEYIAKYLSERVLLPVPEIDAYEKLLKLMEDKGDCLLIESSKLEKIKKSYKDAAADLKSFTSAKDQFERSDFSISNVIRTNLKKLVAHEQHSWYDLAVMNQVIDEQTKILTSFLLLQRDKTEALEELKDYLADQGDTTILFHGDVRKSCLDASFLLHGVNADILRKIPQSNEIVTRKLEVKINDLCKNFEGKQKPIMNTVVEEASNFLSYVFTEPMVLKACNCATTTYKECDVKDPTTQRGVVRPACRCTQGKDVVEERVNIGVRECPSMACKSREGPVPQCPAQDEGQPYPSK
ncbi:hypothetical protein O0L34_g7203 [Tuta absoluta]|nr:hypothetical protein O0L34_g7203 [Tuta absoluta]